MPFDWYLYGLIAVSGAHWIFQKPPRRNFAAPFVISLVALGVLKVAGSLGFRAVEACAALAGIAAIHLVANLLTPVLDRRRIPRLVEELFLAGGYVAVLLALLSKLGVNLTGLITTSAVATAAIGLSLQETLGNLASGITLQVENSLRVGDWIRTSSAIGRVVEMRMRHTVLETPFGDRVLLPNQSVTRETVTILHAQQRQQLPFRVQYGPAPDLVLNAVTEALRSSPFSFVSSLPAPECFLIGFHPDHVEYGIQFYVSRPGTEPPATSELMTRAFCALSRIGAEMLGSTQSIRLARDARSPLDPVRKQGLEMLRDIDVFRSLEPSEIETLAGRLRRLPYGPGEPIIRQGESGDSLYLLQSGKVRILVSHNGKGPKQVAVLGPGDFFGEMSLFTGEARTATVIASESTTCLQLAKADLYPLMLERPGVSRDISEVLVKRKVELESLLEEMAADRAGQNVPDTKDGMLRKIQRFFGIGYSRTAS